MYLSELYGRIGHILRENGDMRVVRHRSLKEDGIIGSGLDNFMEISNLIKNRVMMQIAKLFNPLVNWINNKGWVTLCVLGIFGIIIASTGMLISLITLAKEDLLTFFMCLIVDLIVFSVSAFGLFGVVKLIKNNKDIFKI